MVIPVLPVILRRGLRVVVVACALVCVSLQTSAAGLRLVCDVGGRALEPVRFAQGRVLLADGARELEAPAGAQWRLEGDLRENANLLLLSPSYGLFEWRNNSSGDTTWDAQHPLVGTAGIRHELVSSGTGKPVSTFLDNWPEGTKGDALLVSVWMVDGQASQVQADAIPPSISDNFSRSSRFNLTRDEGRGQAVLLLWQPGGFVAPKSRIGAGLAQEAVVAAIFDDAAALSALLKRGLDPMKTRAEKKLHAGTFRGGGGRGAGA